VSATAQVFLVPGFFGFQTIAGLPYFGGVRELLRDRLAELGLAARVHALDTLPTASIESRARYLGDRLTALVPDDDSPIHLIGHSTGGLDARVLVSPSALPELGPLRARVRSLVGVSTPHLGTPLAEIFVRVEGQKLLRLISLLSVYGLRVAGRPLASALSLGRLLARLDELVLLRESALDNVYRLLADPLSSERVKPIEQFFAAVSDDQSLLRQLRPRAMQGFAQRVEANPNVRYASVLTRARPPRLLGPVQIGLDPVAQVTYAVYQGLYRLCATVDPSLVGTPSEAQRHALVERYGKVPNAQANDGLVPTRSQLHADIIHVARADHHDVIGYFDDRKSEPPHLDWVATGSGFKRPDFDRLWTDVARFIVGLAPASR
jgi:pimeloyl-ACP methyl ester carboxylesterase